MFFFFDNDSNEPQKQPSPDNKMKRNKYNPPKNFLEYQKSIVDNPVYSGMPDTYCDDGTIQWEAPSNRMSGKFKDTHDKRLRWWKAKAIEIGINPNENQWISKTAKKIHPTKLRPCKYCGRVMDIRYLYLSKNLIQRIKRLPYVDERLNIDELTSILDLIPNMCDLYETKKVLDSLPNLLRCTAIHTFPTWNNLQECLMWIENVYVEAEPSLLGPGSMANPPDRFDGFHSFNRCCRAKADKGRTPTNLSLYATDRRAFEFWSDGNWITANKLMGMINTDSNLSGLPCRNIGDGKSHPTPCTADHIGPISLGFVHCPRFQLLCRNCNSGKNNRMYFTDVKYLLYCESKGETVISWYAKRVWDLLKNKVCNGDDALRLSRVMRDNRYNALKILSFFLKRKEFLFLYTILDLSYADYDYSIKAVQTSANPIDKASTIVTATFEKQKMILKYGLIQKARKVRIAFLALKSYSQKENRNGLDVSLDTNSTIIADILTNLTVFNMETNIDTSVLQKMYDEEQVSDEELKFFIENTPNLSSNNHFITSFSLLKQIMNNIGDYLSSKWDDARYTRDFQDEQELF